MPIRNYGVLKGRVLHGIPEHRLRTPHYEILVDAGGIRFRVAVDTRSMDRGSPDLLFFCDEDFRHPLTGDLEALDDGFHPLGGGARLDYVRGGFVRREQMQPLPLDRPGRDNDLNEKVGHWVEIAASDRGVALYAFGGRWGPEPQRRDAVFGFLPGNGLHDVHMNQGNPPGRHAHDNGAGQDGALFFHLQRENRWIALFLAFQSQSWEADGGGHTLEPHPDDLGRFHGYGQSHRRR
ncbi:YukJ family protein [Longimicrobium sp.]|uniref:YukJ family protein n=1 Tax=Longimicrobium sp. TaxID=2029185 RepID=UPI002BBCD02E|nr:YukJ family protein [Longimicrobium sp.]HSU18042.1 YukJ family protein [Longimicrobium sp.]